MRLPGFEHEGGVIISRQRQQGVENVTLRVDKAKKRRQEKRQASWWFSSSQAYVGKLSGVPYDGPSVDLRRRIRTGQLSVHEALRAESLVNAALKCGAFEDASSFRVSAALRERQIDELRALCIAGAELHEDILHEAVSTNYPGALRVILEFAEEVPLNLLVTAASVNAVDTFVVCSGFFSEHDVLLTAATVRTSDGFTCLHSATLFNHVNILKAASAFPEFRSRHVVDARTHANLKQTALHKACRYRFYEVAKLLLRDLGASPNIYDNQGQQPVHVTASLGYSKLLDLLLHYGASPTLADKHSHTPLDHCLRGALSLNHKQFDADFDATISVLNNPPLPDHCPPDESLFDSPRSYFCTINNQPASYACSGLVSDHCVDVGTSETSAFSPHYQPSSPFSRSDRASLRAIVN